MEETIKVLEELINDRKSFICGDKDHDEIYINDIKALKNIINAYKEDERVIEEMANYVDNHCFYSDDDGNYCDVIEDSCYKNIDCKKCIKQYFRNKAREENKE